MKTKIEVRHILKAMTLGMKASEAKKYILEGYGFAGFHGGDWNTNNKAKIDGAFVEGLLAALLKGRDPTLLFYTEPEWTYAGDREDGEPADVTAIRYRCDKEGGFELPYYPKDDSLDLPWYDNKHNADNDAGLLNLLVSDLLGLEEQHERRSELLKKSRKKEVRRMLE